MITGTRKNGRINRIELRDEPIHAWYRFVLSFPPHLVRDYFKRFSIKSKCRVLDPFCGTGTTLVEAKKLGINTIGVEANPMAAFASRVKTDWQIDPNRLVESADRVFQVASEQLGNQGISDWPVLAYNGDSQNELFTLDHDQNKLLLKNSISPLPLHKAIVLLEAINRKPSRYTDFQKLAFAKVLVASASNLHFGPEVGVRKPKIDAAVLSPWIKEVQRFADDIRLYRSRVDVESQVIHGDSRCMLESIPENYIDFVFTSPPYPNEKDYTRTTRLESVLLGMFSNMSEMRDFKKGLLRSNTRNVYKADDDDLHIAGYDRIQEIAREIEERRISMGKTSGFERLYHRVTKLYFGGMKRHLEQMRKVLKPGAVLAYVVGDQASYLRVMIRTGQILAEIAEDLGYQVLGIDLFRTRLATATKEQLNEEVLILQWEGL